MVGLADEDAEDEFDDTVELPRVMVVPPVSGMEVVSVEPPITTTDVVVAFALDDTLPLIGALTLEDEETELLSVDDTSEVVVALVDAGRLGLAELEPVLIADELKLSVMLPDTELELPVVTGAECVWTTAVPFSVQVVVYVVKLDSLDNEADEVVALALFDRLELTPVPIGAAEDVMGAVPERLVELALGVMLADTEPVTGAE